ncbi:hypothetical protein HF1_08010 [Mycoplasma haemofelis str. Langford 1]|uniref:Uncharacterized protein n=1 Tax=Mycoplasma haemofelis (strain Langford 1) TaxID=941640 RepID=E8ZI38_MYCHL|nr:hypothetical protein [Mycoplasma haemofelis]CBY92809.1 hypothetical protein HF1_08010 [Mycoplasma haemofelis str. Langford 1]
MNKLAFTGAGMAGAGGVGLGGYAAYTMVQPSNVKEALIKNNFKLTADLKEQERSKAWTKVEGTYKVEATNDTKIGNKEISATTAQDIESWCKTALEVGVKDKRYESTYSKASRWCVIYTTISEKLTLENKKLSSDTSSLKTKYEGMPEDLKKSITSETDQTGQKTKEWCENNAKRSFLGTQDTHYQNLTKYCLT